MAKKIARKKSVITGLFTMCGGLFLALPTFAQGSKIFNESGTTTLISTNTGLGANSPRTVIGGVINVALGFLTIAFVIMIIYGGFKWLTAAGNEEVVQGARKVLIQATIGLIIVLAAWGITLFVLTQGGQATGTRIG